MYASSDATSQPLSRPNPRKKRLSLSWMKPKKEGSQHGSDSQRDGVSQALSLTAQVSPLLAQPAEILHRIFDFVLSPWSMAILSVDELQDHDLDETFILKKAGSLMVSVPSGYELLFVSRGLYQSFYPRFGENCTGRLVLGKIKSQMRRNLHTYLSSPVRQRFNIDVRSMSLSFSVGYKKFALYTKLLFPNIRHADCVIYEGGYGPMLGTRDSPGSFIRGVLDNYLLTKSQTSVNYFITANGLSWMPPVSGNAKPWDIEEATVDVRMIGTSALWPSATVGFHYRWEGNVVRIISRIFRTETKLICWENGISNWDIGPGNHQIPHRFQWINTSPKW